MLIRDVVPADTPEWSRMRNLLWPSEPGEHDGEINSFFAGKGHGMVKVLVIDRGQGTLGGFIELNLRGQAEGSLARRVPYVEGWFVEEVLRGHGHGADLIRAAETWARTLGYRELASDSDIENLGSIAAHKALGFTEVERMVCFLKQLDDN